MIATHKSPATPRIRTKTIGSDGIADWLARLPSKQTVAGTARMFFDLPRVAGCLLGGWVGRKLGRWIAFFALCFGLLIIPAVLFRGVSSYAPTFLLLTFVAGMIMSVFYGWAPLHLPELLPTRVRVPGQRLAYKTDRIFAAIGALQMGALRQHFDGSYARAGEVITLVYVFGLVLIWFAPETKGRSLPD